MVPRKNNEGDWYLDFGKKTVDIELEGRILACFCNKWLSILIKEIRFDSDDAYLLVDDGLEKEHLALYPCQWISDARN